MQVSAAQADGWHCPCIIVAHHGHTDGDSPAVMLPVGEAPELAALLRILGHPEAAALVDTAVAAVTGEPSHAARADASAEALNDASPGFTVLDDDLPAGRWLTVPEVCGYLQVGEAEWHAWHAAGQTPLHVAMPDGQLRIRTIDLALWLDALPTVELPGPDRAPEPPPFEPLSAYWRQRIREAIDATGARGLARFEIYRLTSNSYSRAQIDDTLAELLASGAYEQITVRTGASGRPPVRYRRTQASGRGNA